MSKRAKKEPKDPGGHKWKGPFPRGWTDESRKKFWDTLTGRSPKHKVTACIKKMQDTSITDPGAFCAALADRVIPGWRQEAAKERRKKKALQTIRKVAAELQQPLRTRRDYGDEENSEKPHSQVPGTDSLPMEEDHRVASSNWISRAEMEKLCPSCAIRMKKAGFTKVHVRVMRKMMELQRR